MSAPFSPDDGKPVWIPGEAEHLPELSRRRRVAWGKIVAAFVRAGWSPPLPDERIVAAITEDIETKSRQEQWWRASPRHAHLREGDVLTARQREVLVLYASGLKGAEIAAKVGISTESVRSHARAARRNLDDARTTTHAVATALRRGLIE